MQIPTIAYSVGGAGNDTLTFTEAPQTGDIIDVRILTTTTQITAISNSPGNAIVQPNATTAIVSTAAVHIAAAISTAAAATKSTVLIEREV